MKGVLFVSGKWWFAVLVIPEVMVETEPDRLNRYHLNVTAHVTVHSFFINGSSVRHSKSNLD